MFFMAVMTDTSFYLYTGYDAALYSAATSYYQQQQAAKVKVGGVGIKTKTKMPPKQPQLHYCDVCKISCAGPQVNIISWLKKY